jgi:glyoxylate carboligase
MANQFRINIILGRSCPDGSVVSSGEFATFLTNEVISLWQVYNNTPSYGSWDGRPEPCNTISILCDQTAFEEVQIQANRIAQTYCENFNQDSVIVEVQQVQYSFITKEG